jgi:hypothetical protein
MNELIINETLMKTLTQFLKILQMILVIGLLSCSEEGEFDEPIKEDPTEQRIKEIIAENHQTLLKDMGMKTNAGETPPNVVGIYEISPNTLQATNQSSGNPVGHVFPAARIQFSDQTGNRDIKINAVNLIGATLTSQSGFIVGTGNNFTIYARATASSGSNSAVFNLIISGTKDGNNLRNLIVSYVNINNANGGNQFISEGEAQIIYDAGSNSQAVSTLEIEPEEEEEDPVSEWGDPDVYIVGFQRSRLGSGYNNLATMWHNGQITILESDGQSAVAYDIVADGNDIFIVGTLTSNNRNTASYWRNGELTKLTDGSTNSEVSAIVKSGNDIYLAGTYANKAVYWKNGEIVELATRGTRSYGHDITEVGGKVYVAGYELFRGIEVAVLWIDGEQTFITDGTKRATLDGVAVSGNDVYVAGREGETTVSTSRRLAKYWKNGKEVKLNEGPNSAFARAIKIHNGDIYVVGDELVRSGVDHVKYWKNNSEVLVSHEDRQSAGYDIEVKGNDVFIAGHHSHVAAFWKNQTFYELPKSDPTDIAQTSAYGLFVKK